MGKPVYSVYWWWAVSVTSNVMLEAWLLMKGCLKLLEGPDKLQHLLSLVGIRMLLSSLFFCLY